ncbi:MAG: hypothetical protein U0325_07240 [Polyangiales bacterium]
MHDPAAPTLSHVRELHARDTPYGRVAVVHDLAHNAHVLEHDGTWHGWQFRDPDRLDEPTGYYYPGTPLWQLVTSLPPGARVGVAGLGAGVMATLTREGHHMTFYEIDPAVAEIAQDPQWFSFLARARGRCDVVVADALQGFAKAPHLFDVVVADAYVGHDVAPGMISPEAVDVLSRALSPRGLLVFHATATATGVDLRPAVAEAARGLHCASCDGRSPRLPRRDAYEIPPGFDLSEPVETRWIVASRDASRVRALVLDEGWQRLRAA